jgi:hypothetical protein
MANEFIARNGITSLGNIVVSGSITTTGTVAISGSIASASFAATASSADNFLTRGTLTAQTLVVQTITSSVMYSSGSNVFGNNIANTQVFTGSMNLTGSLTVTTTGTELQVNASGVNLGNALTDSHVISGSLRVNPNGLFVSGSGLVGIGTTSPEGVLTIQGTSAQPSTSGTIANSLLQLVGSLNNQLNIGSNTVAGDYGSYIQSSDNNLAVPYPLNLQPNGGNVGIGTSTPSQKLEVVGGEIKAGRIDSSNEGGQVSFGRSTDNATAWYIDAYGNSSSTQLRFVNVTNAVVAMTLTGSNVGIGVNNPNSILQVGSAQSLAVIRSTTTTNYAELQVENTTNYLQIGVEGATGNRMGGTIAYNAYLGSYANYGMTFHTNNLNRMTITNGGNVGMATTSPAALLTIKGRGGADIIFQMNDENNVRRCFYIPNQYYGYMWAVGVVSNNGKAFSFGNQDGTEVGSIQITATGVNYTSNSSDIRKKKNFENWEEAVLPYFKDINPQKFNYTIEEDGESKTKGFIAQEMYDKFPEAYPLDLDGFHSFNPGGMVVYLMKAIQELTARVQELENK